jgi:prefoldin alpha subunit
MTISSKDYVLLETYNKQLSLISQNIELISQQLEYLHIAESMINELSKTNPSQELLIPIGAGLFLPVNAVDISSIKTSVGAGIVVDKTPSQAKKYILERKKSLENNYEKFTKDYDIVSLNALKLQEELDKKV